MSETPGLALQRFARSDRRVKYRMFACREISQVYDAPHMSNLPNKQIIIVLGILERDGRFLIIRRVDGEPMWHHKWELPGGGIEPGETPLEALHREVREETGLTIASPELLGVHTHHWHLPDHTLQTFILPYRAQVVGTASVILDPKENDADKWVTLDEFLAMPLEEQLGANRNMIEEMYAPKQRK